MRAYPIAIFKDEGNPTYGVVVPDVPGCYPCGDSIQEAIEDSRKAIATHIECLLDTGRPFDFERIRSIEELRALPDYADALCWAVAEIDEATLSEKPIRFNVSWPEHLLRRVNDYVAANHDSRSGFLAKAAIQRMNERGD